VSLEYSARYGAGGDGAARHTYDRAKLTTDFQSAQTAGSGLFAIGWKATKGAGQISSGTTSAA